jgi:predicted nucleic acid-binding protein
MVIVDATVWIDYLRGDENPQTEWLENQLTLQPIGLVDLTLCEVLQGVRGDSEFAQVREDLLRFHLFETGGRDLAIAAALNYRTLRESGRTVRKTIDCLIASFCLQAGHTLLHRDRDYEAFEKGLGLRVVQA